MPCEHKDGHLQAREGSWNRSFPDGLQKEPPLPTLPPQTSRHRNSETTNVCCLNQRSVSSVVASPGHWHSQWGLLPSPGTLRPTQSHIFNHFSSSPLISGPKMNLLILSFILFCFKYFRMTIYAVLKLRLYKQVPIKRQQLPASCLPNLVPLPRGEGL